MFFSKVNSLFILFYSYSYPRFLAQRDRKVRTKSPFEEGQLKIGAKKGSLSMINDCVFGEKNMTADII